MFSRIRLLEAVKGVVWFNPMVVEGVRFIKVEGYLDDLRNKGYGRK